MVVLVILTEWSSPLAGGFRGAHTETQVVFVVVRSQRPSHTPPPLPTENSLSSFT